MSSQRGGRGSYQNSKLNRGGSRANAGGSAWGGASRGTGGGTGGGPGSNVSGGDIGARGPMSTKFTAAPKPQQQNHNTQNDSAQGPFKPANTNVERGWAARGRGRGGPVDRLKAATPSRMELMPSVSRAGGLEKGGDDLKNFKIQEEYRHFVTEKFEQFIKRHYPRRFLYEKDSERTHRIEQQENVLLLFRKLREGVQASNRKDGFALEVYESSLYLSVIFDHHRQQPASVIPHLIPTLYQSARCPQPLRLTTLILSLLHHLSASYPSQTAYYTHLKSIPPTMLPRDSKALKWISSVARSLRARNYAQFERLTRISNLADILEVSIEGTMGIEALTNSPRTDVSRVLAHGALLTALDALRAKARETFWMVMRSAYRELSCTANSGATKEWISRSLCLESRVSEDLTVTAEGWLDQEARKGNTRRKEGVEGRWIVCKGTA